MIVRFAGLGLAFVLQAQAADEPALLPSHVKIDLDGVIAECTDAGGIARSADAVKRADLNRDGREDYVLDVGAIVCVGAASIYGDRAKAVRVYGGDGRGGARPVFEDRVFGVTLRDDVLWLTVAGAQCGKPPAPDFASENFCERPLAWNASGEEMHYAPLSSVRMVQ
jgi:hypothetical protein